MLVRRKRAGVPCRYVNALASPAVMKMLCQVNDRRMAGATVVLSCVY
jgi:hypothetical protein